MGRHGQVFIIIGTIFIVAALSLVLYTRWRSQHAGETVSKALAQLEQVMPAEHPGSGVSSAATAATDADGHPSMPAAEVDGNSYIGIVRIPALGLSLPVLGSCSDALLDVAPCCYSGSVYDGTLVIAGRDYQAHFGKLQDIQVGDEVAFTDVDGQMFSYTVASIENPDEVDDGYLSTVAPGSSDNSSGSGVANGNSGAGSSGASLTLFAYLSVSRRYVVVRCSLA